ncbi:MAG: adenosylcobinamide-phosphate synthase CbiB [Lachnospiraceae bacterium]|nr:adenosylcobinamide-phosphate synthase CbiB [Lachnospiraceae bacterium]
MRYHMTAFFLGYLLDLLVGDPWNIPHPIRWIGRLIDKFDHIFLDSILKIHHVRNPKRERTCGLLIVVLVVGITSVLTALILGLSYALHPFFGVFMEMILTCYILAARSLERESRKVQDALLHGTLVDARYAVSMIVGRDTGALDAAGVTRAAVETVAENTSDGVIGPLLYTCLGGPILGMTYKAINTMDSMIGYHSDRYENFGFFAAKLDDVVNFLPARLSAIFMVVAAGILGKDYSAKNAWKIYLRDRYHHKSPNSAQTESVCAGALGLRLAGDASYFGKIVKKPYIGDAMREIEPEDIRRACKLMFVTEGLTVFLCMLAMGIIVIVF